MKVIYVVTFLSHCHFVFSFRMFGITHVVAVYSIAQLIGHYHVEGEVYDILFIFDLISF